MDRREKWRCVHLCIPFVLFYAWAWYEAGQPLAGGATFVP